MIHQESCTNGKLTCPQDMKQWSATFAMLSVGLFALSLAMVIQVMTNVKWVQLEYTCYDWSDAGYCCYMLRVDVYGVETSRSSTNGVLEASKRSYQTDGNIGFTVCMQCATTCYTSLYLS